jgi:hypothetical protein
LSALALRALTFTAQTPTPPTDATLSGIIRDSNGDPLQNVLVAVGTASATTNASGAYQITGLAPGAATVTASLSGYQTATGNITLVVGAGNLFSPTLYATGATPPATSVQGMVVNTAGAPIAGANVTLGNANLSTDASGQFQFTNQNAGAFTLTIAASGYASVTVTASMAARPLLRRQRFDQRADSLALFAGQRKKSIHGALFTADQCQMACCGRGLPAIGQFAIKRVSTGTQRTGQSLQVAGARHRLASDPTVCRLGTDRIPAMHRHKIGKLRRAFAQSRSLQRHPQPSAKFHLLIAHDSKARTYA